MAESRNLRRNLVSCAADGAAYGVMVGMGETYVPAFVLALGLGSVLAGMVTTVPMVLGSLVQLASPKMVHRLGSLRRWVVICSLLQGLCLLPLVYVALRPASAGWIVYLTMIGYWAFGLAAGPAWNQWVEHLFPKRLRANFFARRSRWNQASLVIGLVCGGLLLRGGEAGGDVWQRYAWLFGLATGFRLLSTWMLWRQTDADEHELPEPNFQARSRQRPGLAWSIETRRLMIYLFAIQASVYIAGPYFTPYMLVKLELSYTHYMVLLCAGFLGKVLAFPLAGNLANRMGPQRLLWLGGWLIVPVAALWLLSENGYYLLGLQVLTGGFWALFELGMFLMFLESIPKDQRVAVLTWYNVGNSAAMLLGSAIGAAVLAGLGTTASSFLILFSLSSLGRLGAMALFPDRTLRHWHTWHQVVIRTVAVRPGAASVDRPVTAGILRESPVEVATPASTTPDPESVGAEPETELKA